jgi:hypothetical protein
MAAPRLGVCDASIRCHRHSPALAQSCRRDHSFPLRFANALRTTGCESGSARAGARPGRLSARCPFHRRSGSVSCWSCFCSPIFCCFFPMPSCGLSAVREPPFLCVSWGSLKLIRCPRSLAPTSSLYLLCRCTRQLHSCLTRCGNRADDIGSGKLGTRFALEFV